VLTHRAKTLVRRWFRPAPSELVPSVRRALLLRPFIFEIWFRTRAVVLPIVHRPQELRHEGGTRWLVEPVLRYNIAHAAEFHRIRTELLMVVCRCVHAQDASRTKVLCVGPRNEAEVLLLEQYGFAKNNITAIDLFSYSNRITCMDMHALDFEDSTFDVVYIAWTLTYSGDVEQACREAKRVLRSGGTLAIGFEEIVVTDPEWDLPQLRDLAQLFELLGEDVGWVYWQHRRLIRQGTRADVTVVVRIDKE